VLLGYVKIDVRPAVVSGRLDEPIVVVIDRGEVDVDVLGPTDRPVQPHVRARFALRDHVMHGRYGPATTRP